MLKHCENDTLHISFSHSETEILNKINQTYFNKLVLEASDNTPMPFIQCISKYCSTHQTRL